MFVCTLQSVPEEWYNLIKYEQSVVWNLKQVIREILDGNFKYDNGSLDFSCPRIELSVHAGCVEEGSFTIYGPQGCVTEGYIVSSDLRMQCITQSFGGSQDEIFYRVDTSEMEAGNEIKGAFHIVSNQGEYYLPFSVAVIDDVIESSLGPIKNLFHFTNLAKSNWAEAVNLFYSEEFERVFTGNDKQFFSAYKGLSKIHGNEHNMEEFLLEINKKKPVEFIPEETEIKIEDPIALSRYALVINRNGWGYTSLRIETEGDFLKINEERVSEDAFLGNLYRLYYYIDDTKLHAGNNYGCIRLIHCEQVINIPVTIVNHMNQRSGRKISGLRKEKKWTLMQLMEYYQAFRLKKISTRTWMQETGKLVERMQQLDDKDIAARLFRAQLIITEERYNEARWILEQEREKVEALQEEQPALWCYFLYLTTLYSKEDSYVDEVAREISGVYERNRGNWRIAWLLLFLSEEYTKSPTRKWGLLEELFKCHCTSPMIYVEAWHLLCMNPAMLLKLGEFELQILNYAVKHELMKDEIVLQLLYLAQKQKGYSERLFRILCICYEERPQNDILHAICTTLIKGNKYGSKYFRWYQAGVEQNLRITRLYEYYMMSATLDEKATLPKMILMYFSYQSDLSYEITAYIYAYVYKRQEEIPEIFASYLPAIEHFVVEQIKRGRINKDLAYLYRNIIKHPMVDEENAEELMTLLFMNDITVESDNIRKIILVYPYCMVERAYPVVGRKAQVPIYDADCKIVLEDVEHNRYTSSVAYQVERLITTGKLSIMAAPFIQEHLGYNIYTCFDHKNIVMIHEENVERFKQLADSVLIAESYRQEIRLKLVQFYYEKDRMRELDEYLLTLEPEMIAIGDRKDIVRIMVLRGMYPEAYEWIRICGPYGMDAKVLVKLCSRLLEQDEFEENTLMTGVLHYVLKKGKYDELVLQYLVKYYDGNIKDMRDIWRAAKDFGVDTYELSERILVQMLYTGSYIGEKTDIFRSYIKEGGKDKLIAAFLSQCCYDYVVKEKITEVFFIQNIMQLYQKEIPLHLVCKIAYLKYYAENQQEITEEMKASIKLFLQDMIQEKIVLPMFKEYQGYLPALDQYLDKSILEYRAKPGHRAVIHFLLQKEDGVEQEYSKEEMQEVFAGICVKEFILFFGERLQYYITEEEDGKEQLTQSGTISKSDIGNTVLESRFSMLNDIMIGKTLQDYDTVGNLLEEYYKKDFMVDKLFTML